MVMSSSSIRLLRWMCRHDQWYYIEDIENQYKRYEYRSFAALKEAGYVDVTVFDYDLENPEYDEDGTPWYREHYRISDCGKAFLESLPSLWLSELREWIAVGVSILALIISIIAIVLE